MRVLAFGTFDQFHLGHEAYLKQTRALGDELVVVIARDETVKKIKGRYPEWNEFERKNAVEKSGIADEVILGDLYDKYKVIKKIKPDIIALGYDQFVFTYLLEKFLIDEKINAKIMRMQPYKAHIYKTSLLKNKI